MKLGIVIVHYNTSADLRTCLDSLGSHPASCPHGIVVVDNASTDPGLDEVREDFPAVRWLLNTENTGYARGCNQGMAALPAEYHLILNPDIVVQPGAVDRLLEFAEAHPRAGIIGPQLLNEDGSIQESCRRFYTFRTLLLRRTILGRIFPGTRTVQQHLMKDFDHLAARPVDWVLGGCMLVRHGAVERTGPMDERFFLYFEDVDWCYRMWQAGCEVLYTPDARFQHRHRRSSARGTFNRSFWLHLASLISFYEKWGLLVWLVKKWREPLLVGLYWLLDMAGVGFGFLAAYGLRRAAGSLFPEPLFPFREYVPLLGFALLLVSVVYVSTGRYAAGRLRRPPAAGQELQRVGLVFLLLLASTYLGNLEVVSRAVLLIFLPLLAVSGLLSHRLLAAMMRRLEKGRLALERTLLAGSPQHLQEWLRRAGDLPDQGVDLVGFCAGPGGAPALPPLAGGRVPWLGRPEDLVEIVKRYRISQVVFWDGPSHRAEDLKRWAALRRMRVRLRWRVADVWLLAAGARAEMFGGFPSAVLVPGGRAALGAAGRRLGSLVAGSLLALVAGPAWIFLRRIRQRRRSAYIQRVQTGDVWGYHFDFEAAVGPDGHALGLPWQWPLVRGLIRGRVMLLGERPLGGVRQAGEPDAAAMLDFWRSDPMAPALSGPWAAAGDDGPGGWRNGLRQLWRDPGRLDGIVAAGAHRSGSGVLTSPEEEVT